MGPEFLALVAENLEHSYKDMSVSLGQANDIVVATLSAIVNVADLRVGRDTNE